MPDLSLKFADLEPRQRYKLLCGLVVPRPIALVSSPSPEGVVSAAPYSFFSAISENLALIVLGLQHNADGTPKDTTRNIHVTGEFVVNLADEALAEAMTLVKPPRMAAAPAAFECLRAVGLAFGPQLELLIIEVLGVHVRAGVVDPVSLNVDFAALRPVGWLCGNHYARQRDMFELTRITYAERRRKRKKPQA